MPDNEASSRRAIRSLETAAAPPPCEAPLLAQQRSEESHGAGAVAIATATDTPAATTLPPAITPATTTRQSVPLGVLSTLWGANGALTVLPLAPPVPTIVAHAPSPVAAEQPPVDLATSTSSVPSATTTLTNTLPPTQSAALRALNAPAFQSHASSISKSKSAKSASSRTTVSSQPVVVRTYSGSRHNSRNSSGVNSPRYPPMDGHPTQKPSALSAGLAGHAQRLPSIEDFSFSAILRAVDPEIRDAIDAIAEICARSRMSLADEYDAHLPPQGEITGTGPGWAAGVGSLAGRGRISRISQGWTAAENTLTAVPEASSSSERLAAENRSATSNKQRSQSAYGSLKSVISGGSGKRRQSNPTAETPEAGPSPQVEEPKPRGPAWAVHTLSEDHPVITVPSPQASNQLSLDTSSTIKDMPDIAGRQSPRPQTAVPNPAVSHRRNISLNSLPAPRPRSGTLSSITSWLAWPRPTDTRVAAQQEPPKAETRLREVLMVAQSSVLGKGKTAVSVA